MNADGVDGPFIHLFRTSDHCYVYDINTNRIFQIDEAAFRVLALGLGWSSPERLAEKLPDIDADRLQEAVDKCTWLQEELGVFSNHRPEGMLRPDPKGEQRILYETGLEHMILEVTQACNLRCRYCTFSDAYPLNRSYSPSRMSFETAVKAIDYFLDHSINTESATIGFYGGEPLLEFDLMKRCMEHAKERAGDRKLEFAMTTNGTLITPEILDYLAENRMRMRISLDGPPECNDRNRIFKDGSPTSSRIIESLEMIRESHEDYYNEFVGLTTVIATDSDPAEIKAYYDGHRHLMGNKSLICNYVDGMNTDYWQQNPPSPEWQDSVDELKWQYYESLIRGDEKPDEMLVNLFRMNFLKIYRRPITETLPDRIPLNGCCVAGKRRLYVDCHGTFHLCERINNLFPIGSIETGIDLDRVHELLDEYCTENEQACSRCWLLRLCSQCFTSCAHDGRFSVEMRRRECADLRHTFHHLLEDYCRIVEINPNAFESFADIVLS